MQRKTELFASVGFIVMLSQQIELVLGLLLVIERSPETFNRREFIESLARTRKPLEALDNELRPYLGFYPELSELAEAKRIRNLFCHNLPVDRRFLDALKEDSKDCFEDCQATLISFLEKIQAALNRRLAEKGMHPEDATYTQEIRSLAEEAHRCAQDSRKKK